MLCRQYELLKHLLIDRIFLYIYFFSPLNTIDRLNKQLFKGLFHNINLVFRLGNQAI